jgi:hypothetical protein
MRPGWKALAFLIIFTVLHFAYEWTGWRPLMILSGTSESVFEHLKMAFWSYALLSAAEALWQRRRWGRELGGQLYARAVSTLLVPWVIVIVWYLVPGIVGKVDSIALDLGWAIGVTYLAGWVGAVLEREMSGKRPSPVATGTAVALLAISCFFFVRFSFGKPWLDLFVDPVSLK